MKMLLKISLSLVLLTTITNSFAGNLPNCKDRSNSILTGSINEIQQIMKSKADRPQMFVKGTVSKILPEDKAGLPHQKYLIKVANNISMLIVSNLDFGRVPIQVGSEVAVCGEFKAVGQGMVHWTHADPHGGHPDGFTIFNNQVYGTTELPR